MRLRVLCAPLTFAPPVCLPTASQARLPRAPPVEPRAWPCSPAPARRPPVVPGQSVFRHRRRPFDHSRHVECQLCCVGASRAARFHIGSVSRPCV
eukprot:7893868-Alexandrium_andersonii.AAC.1